MQDNYENNSKYEIIEMYGIQYKVTHLNKSSKTNKFLLRLGQIKYFIKIICKKTGKNIKKLLIYIRENILENLINYVCDHYSNDVYAGLMSCITMGAIGFILFTISSEIIKTIKDFKSYDNIIYKMLSLMFILFIKIILILIGSIFTSITALLILCIISILLRNIGYILKSIINILKIYITSFYKQIPDMEEVELDIL